MWSRVFTALLFFPAALYPQNTDPLTFQAVSAHLDSFKITDFRVFVYKNGVPVYQNPQEERKTEKQKICLGELSAVFTHLAVMKLAETGKIRLEDDAFKLAGLSHYSRTENPVTVLQLLTHSHNLRHSVFRLMTLSAAGKKIRATESIRTRRISFTNTAGPLNKVPYSASLLALIIEKNTGRSFEDFMRSEIFIPLGMNEATYTAPDSAPRSLYPADSGLWVSGSDIEKFLAFLSSPDPEYADLFKNKKEYLRTDIYSPSPHLPKCGYVFCESRKKRDSVVFQSGLSPDGYQSILFLPGPAEAALVSHNSHSPDFYWFLRSRLITPVFSGSESTQGDLPDLTGYYIFSNASDGIDLFWYSLRGVRIRVNSDFRLITAEPVTHIPPLLKGEPVSLVQESPVFFRALENQSGILLSSEKPEGRWMFSPTEAELPSFLQQSELYSPLLTMTSLGVFLFYFMRYSLVSMHSYCYSLAVRISGRIISLLHILFLLLFYPVFAQPVIPGGLPALSYDTTFSMYLLLTVPLLTLAANIWFWIWLPVRYREFAISLKWFKFIIINILFYLFLYHWNLLGYPL